MHVGQSCHFLRRSASPMIMRTDGAVRWCHTEAIGRRSRFPIQFPILGATATGTMWATSADGTVHAMKAPRTSASAVTQLKPSEDRRCRGRQLISEAIHIDQAPSTSSVSKSSSRHFCTLRSSWSLVVVIVISQAID